MALLSILRYPDARLHKVAAPVTVFDESLKKLVADMTETMYAAPGIGLAATQVDVHKQVIVVDVSERRDSLVVLVNPEIVEATGVSDIEEGCLSVPGIYELVERAERVKVRAYDQNGKAFTLEAQGLLAVCIQHEMDHLQGKVFVEYLSQLKQQRIRAKRPDALVVAAYGLILPQAVLDVAAHGALNIHASLLPRWRGAAPIQRAILAGDAQTGVSIMQMDAGLDTGAVLAQSGVPIAPDDDAGTLHDKLAALGAEMIVATLAEVQAGRVLPVPQPQQGVTYASKLGKQETLLDWSRPAVEFERAVRAFRPSPGAATLLDGARLKLWRAAVTRGRGTPGELLSSSEAGLVVASGKDALAITELQRPGGRRLAAGEFLRGHPLAPGVRFG